MTDFRLLALVPASLLVACADERADAATIPTEAAAPLAGDAEEAAARPQWQDYSPKAFKAAQEAGRTVVVDVHAKWCPTCKAQAPILDSLRSEAALANAVFFKVDYDEEKMFLKDHRIPRQSTVLVFDGKREVARSIAETNAKRLRAAVLDAI